MALILPSDIDTHQQFTREFANPQTGQAANHIVRFLQANGNNWNKFQKADLNAFYRQKTLERRNQRALEEYEVQNEAAGRQHAHHPGWAIMLPRKPIPLSLRDIENYDFAGLLLNKTDAEQCWLESSQYLIMEDDQITFKVTDEFIKTCFKAAGILEI